MQKFLNIKFHQIIFTNPRIWTTGLKLVKENKQGHPEARKFKNKKN